MKTLVKKEVEFVFILETVFYWISMFLSFMFLIICKEKALFTVGAPKSPAIKNGKRKSPLNQVTYPYLESILS